MGWSVDKGVLTEEGGDSAFEASSCLNKKMCFKPYGKSKTMNYDLFANLFTQSLQKGFIRSWPFDLEPKTSTLDLNRHFWGVQIL